MASFRFQVNEQNVDISLSQTKECIVAEINGTKSNVQILKTNESQIIFKINDKKFKTYCAKNNDVWYINIDNHSYLVKQDGYSTKLKNNSSTNDDNFSGEIRAQMPGKIIQLYVTENEHVESNQKLMAIEAMKMEHKIVAPQAGSIKKINYKAGDVVSAGQLLVEMQTDIE